MAASKEAFFKPGKLSAQDRASLTDNAAKQVDGDGIAVGDRVRHLCRTQVLP